MHEGIRAVCLAMHVCRSRGYGHLLRGREREEGEGERGRCCSHVYERGTGRGRGRGREGGMWRDRAHTKGCWTRRRWRWRWRVVVAPPPHPSKKLLLVPPTKMKTIRCLVEMFEEGKKERRVANGRPLQQDLRHLSFNCWFK